MSCVLAYAVSRQARRKITTVRAHLIQIGVSATTHLFCGIRLLRFCEPARQTRRGAVSALSPGAGRAPAAMYYYGLAPATRPAQRRLRHLLSPPMSFPV